MNSILLVLPLTFLRSPAHIYKNIIIHIIIIINNNNDGTAASTRCSHASSGTTSTARTSATKAAGNRTLGEARPNHREAHGK